MATWSDFEAESPELAAFATRLWPGIVALQRGEPLPDGAPCFAVSYIASVRRDGGPRLHPFCPILAGVARSKVGGMIESVRHDPLFEFDLEQVDVAWWLDIGEPGTRVVRRRWRATGRST